MLALVQSIISFLACRIRSRAVLELKSSLIALMLVLSASLDVFAGTGCSPFGDPPAQVDRGWFASFVTARNSMCLGATRLGPWTDGNGDARYACLYEPQRAGEREPLPMLVFLHPSETSAYSVILTGLVGLIDKGVLNGGNPGFILLAPQGRYTTHRYPGYDSNALGWDNWYRQLSTGAVAMPGAPYEENADAASIDHFVDEMIATGKVDRQRIYVMGWSNGAAMALLYALNRRWVAAAAVYSAPDPFSALFDVCTQTPVAIAPVGDGQAQVFNPRVPLMHVRNDCDIGGICPNGNRFAARVRALGGSIEDVIVDSSEQQVASCDDSCGTDEMANGQIGTIASFRGLARHMRWPAQWNERMLNFLREHPLSIANDQAKRASGAMLSLPAEAVQRDSIVPPVIHFELSTR
jgi:predicted esterase